MGFPPIQPPLGALPEYGQPYHAWWKQEKQRNPYADAPVFSAREATPGSGSNSTATTRTKSSRRTTSTSSSSRHSYQGGALGSQPKRFGRSQSARTRGPATGPHAQELQKRVNETLRELEQIKAGTHAVCMIGGVVCQYCGLGGVWCARQLLSQWQRHGMFRCKSLALRFQIGNNV